MAYSLVCHTGKATAPNGGTTDAIDTTGATLLIVMLGVYIGEASNVFSDSKGNTWTALTNRSSSVSRTRVYYCVNPTVGTGHTFTYFGGSSSYAAITVLGFSGVAATPFDAENGAVSNSCNSLATGSVTPSEDNELVIAFAAQYADTGTETIDSGFSTGDSIPAAPGNNVGGTSAYKIQTSAAAVNPTFSFGTTIDAAVMIACFKAGAGGGSAIKTINGLAKASVKTRNGLAIASAKTINGLA